MKSLNVVYKYDYQYSNNATPSSLGDCILIEWKPTLISIIPKYVVFEWKGCIKNWIYHLPRLFFHDKYVYSIYTLRRGDEILSQCIVHPSSKRFSFMKPQDLQFGLVFTPQNQRNKKYANLMVKEILRRNPGENRSFWWITENENISSRKLAERVGFKFLGNAMRKSILGLSYYTMKPSK